MAIILTPAIIITTTITITTRVRVPVPTATRIAKMGVVTRPQLPRYLYRVRTPCVILVRQSLMRAQKTRSQ
jgi:hypothetical protein